MSTKSLMLVLATSLVFILQAEAGINIQTVDAPINNVTIYTDRAQITRTTTINLSSGDFSLLVENLPVSADDASFRASVMGPKGITILGLNHKIVRHLQTPQKKVAELEKKIIVLERGKKKSLVDNLEVLEEQKKLLMAISQGAGEEMARQVKKADLDVSQWGAAYDFIGRKLMEVNDSVRSVSMRLSEVENELGLLKSNLNALKTPDAKKSKTVQIDLLLENEGEIEFSLIYMIRGAGWQPVYNARLMDDSSKVSLAYFAEVSQRTGEDWNNVELNFSTAMPSYGTGPTDLTPKYLSFAPPTPGQPRIMKYQTSSAVKMKPAGIASLAPQDRIFDEQKVAGTYTTADFDAGAYSTTFKARRRETVISGDGAIRAPIAQWSLDAEIDLISRPYVEEAVYRLVSIQNQDKAPLLPGDITIFAGADFLGREKFNQMIMPGQVFKLMFGWENDVSVKREILSHKKSIKNELTRIDKRAMIILTNHSQSERTVILEEPIPVSQDDRIKVKSDDIKPKPLAIDAHGKAVWEITIKPGAEISVIIPWRVEHPENMPLVGL